MIVAACARIQSTSAPRRAALQRSVWSHPRRRSLSRLAPPERRTLGASLASKARDLKPGDGFVAPVAAAIAPRAASRTVPRDVAVSGVGAEALAWHEYRVGQDGAVRRPRWPSSRTATRSGSFLRGLGEPRGRPGARPDE